jgi:hypothetical protein
MFFFFMPDSRYQKHRIRKSLDYISRSIADTAVAKRAVPAIEIIYKNRRFAVGLVHKEVNSVYSYYEIYINGELAANYHRMRHNFFGSYYRFEEVNNRHRNEVTAIVHAAANSLRQSEKPKKVEQNGYTEYSYFT